MAEYLGSPLVHYDDNSGDPLSGGKLHSYEPGTTTNKATYPTIADAVAGTNPNANPIILDSRGEAVVVLQGTTKLVLKDSDDNEIWSEDNVGTGTGNLLDANGNELLIFTTAALAVNELTLANAATGDPVSLTATGDDTNIVFKASSKGSSTFELDGGATGDLELNKTSTGTVRARRALQAHSTLGVTGAATLSSTLGVTGATTLSDTLGVTGLATLNAGLSVPSGQPATGVVPAGMVMHFAGTSAPTGWLACDGSAVSRTTYATLFAAISTTWGVGDGSTTFNLPTSARNTIVGSGGSGTGTLGSTVGSSGGAETHTLSTAEMPAHTHLYDKAVYGLSYASGGAQGSTTTTSTATTSTGSNGAHNNMQPSIVMLMCIKAY